MKAAVVGAGISGLVAARELAMAGWTVALFDSAARSGGKIAAGELGFDVGAESMLARRPEAVQLVDDLGLTERLVHPTAASSGIWLGGAVHPIPPSVQGVPGSVETMADLLSADGLARLADEPRRPAPALADDVSIGTYVAQRCGDEVVDRLLEPLLGGVFAGHSRELSFAAVNSRLWARARAGGSLLEHAASLITPPGPSADPVFAGLRGGVHTLVQALEDDLGRRGGTIHRSSTVRALERVGQGWRLEVGPVPASYRVEVDAVVSAAPARPTARLLGSVVPSVTELLDEIPYASMAVITLVLRHARLAGSGLLVPPGELPTVKALTHSSLKWDWIGASARGRWGADVEVVRASVGRLGEDHLLQLPDDELIARTVGELRDRLPGWAAAELVTGQVSRWGGGLPQYTVGHVDRIASLRDQVAASGRLAVCGAYLDGVGIPACIAAAQRAVRTIVGS